MEQSPKQSPAAVEPVAWRASWNKAPDGWLLYNSRPDAGPDYTVEPLYSAASLSHLSTKLENAKREIIKRLWPNGLGPKSLEEIAIFIEEERACDAQYRDELRAKLAEARAAAFKEAAQIASDFADSEAIHAIAGMAISTGVKSPGWIKDALHSQGQEIATNISKAIHARAVKGVEEALILNPRAARIAELPDFMAALSEWGCDDPNEQAAAITDFLNSLVGLREYLEDSTHLPAKEPADV